jgi:hypothetical protein
MNNSIKLARPILIVFVILSAFFVIGKSTLLKWNIDHEVLIAGNLIIFALVLVSFFMLERAIRSSNPHSFLKGMYMSFLVKFFLLALAAFIYIQVEKKDVNKGALFACIGLYFVYTFMEVSALMKQLKSKKNA